ncbi:MAG: rhomboid family intramembrane serine protease [Anaerolineales bacterium]|nr:rhomboid family intramembrane serine protease [Anaerolineales bacterium]
MYDSPPSQSPVPPPARRWSGAGQPPEQPLVSYTLLGVTVLVFALQLLSELTLGVDYPAMMGMKVNYLIVSGELWRLITPVFLHGSILHIGFNMYALYIIGMGLERQYGRARFLVLYFLAGFAGNVLSFLFSQAPSLGSSTAIFGIIGAQGVFFYRNRHIFGAPAQRALMNIVMIAAINLVIGMSPGIDNWGHIGGLIGGTLFAWFAGPLLRLEGGYFAPLLVDEHDSGDTLRSGLAIAALFSLLAALGVFWG